jgi:hypothetical protein
MKLCFLLFALNETFINISFYSFQVSGGLLLGIILKVDKLRKFIFCFLLNKTFINVSFISFPIDPDQIFGFKEIS